MDDRTLEQKAKAIEDAFRKLPIKKFGPIGIPYEVLIPGIGRELLYKTPTRGPRSAPPKRALHDLKKANAQLIDVLERLPSAVVTSLNLGNLRGIMQGLRILQASADLAKPASQSGAPEKTQAAEIARAVAQHYYGLTGKKPTVPKKDGKAYGPFLVLLKEIFSILGVNASAEAQADKIARNWKAIAAEFRIME